MNKKNVFKELWLIAIVLLPIAMLMIVWNRLPAQMPIHWDINGHPNGYGPRWSYPAIAIGIYVLLLVLPRIDPLKKNYEIFGDSYFKLKLIMVLFFSATSTCIIVNELYHNINIGKVISSSVFLLLALIGNYLGNIRRNYFIGYKIPWTLNNDEVWKKTHVLAGKLCFWGGLLGFTVALTNINKIYLLIPILTIITIVPMIYAYFIHRKLGKN
jgi:uncharacterized membrane protein